MNSVTEKIDERILRLLGLEDVFDLDYDTYLTLLKEEIVKGANKLPQEELALLANERKRIRGKKGRFIPKREEVKTKKDSAVKFLKGSKVAALPYAISKQDPTQSQSNLIVIEKPLQAILKTLNELLKFRKKEGEEKRKEKETQKRAKEEESLEGFKKGISAISSAAKKMLAPFQSIIDRIWKFIFFTLLGRAFTQLMNWLGDPKNKKKIEVLGRFLKDWWPSLAFAAGLFLTPFGKFIRTTLTLLRGFIPQIAKFILANPVVFGTAALAVGSVALKKLGDTEKENQLKKSGYLKREAARTGKTEKQIREELKNIEQRSFQIQTFTNPMINPGEQFSTGGLILPRILSRFSGGGINFGTGYDGIDGSTGQRVSGFGPDTQMIVAQPGEIVINKKTVDAVGAEPFLVMNRQYGGPGANKPKTSRAYNLGGVVQRFQSGGMVGNKSPKINTSDYNALLALSALEADEPQGRADVAQSLYNRLYAANKYGINFNQSTNSLKNLITASSQYEPTFSNRGDWLNIKDKNSAAVAIMNSAKGKRYNWDIKEAMRQLDATEKALRNPSLQTQSQQHVGGRAFFLGTSQHGNMGPGDVLRGPKSNFFSPWYLQGSTYDKERRNIASPIPEMLLPKRPSGAATTKRPKSTAATKSSGAFNMFATMMQFLPSSLPYKGGGLIGENTGMNISGATADRQLTALQPGEYVLPSNTVTRLGGPKVLDHLVAMTDSNSTPFRKSVNKPQITPLSRGNRQGMITLPPITQSSGGAGGGSPAGSKVPVFSATSPTADAERSMNASIYGIVG